jgi:hypothetical protein
MGNDLLASATPTITYAPPEGIFNYIWVIIALPAIGALILLTLGNRTNKWGHYLATVLPIGSFRPATRPSQSVTLRAADHRRGFADPHLLHRRTWHDDRAPTRGSSPT